MRSAGLSGRKFHYEPFHLVFGGFRGGPGVGAEMNFLIVFGILGVAYLIFKNQTGGLTGGTSSFLGTGVPDQSPGIGAAVAPEPTGAGGLGLAEAAAGSAGAAGGPIGTAAAQAFDSIVNIFAAQSALRRKQATTENTMLQKAVPGYDAEIAQVVNAYNQGRLTASQVLMFFASPQTQGAGITSSGSGIVWQTFWADMTPVIQPGRNGCQSGSVPHTVSFCTGDKRYGAACCVGYDNLDNSLLYLCQALIATENDGQPHAAQVVAVYGSKYGGINRPAYSLTLQKPGAVAQFTGGVTGFLGGLGL